MTTTPIARAWRTLPTVIAGVCLVTGCVAQPLQMTALTPMNAHEVPAASAYTHAEAAFALTSPSEAAARAMVPALQSTSTRFTELFGDDAPRIIMTVDDTPRAERALTVRAANTWIDAYANAWSNTVTDGGYAETSIHGASVPEWFQTAAVNVLANEGASAHSARTMARQLRNAPSLASLFASTASRRESPLFREQATSVFEFLRTEFGMDPTYDLLVPLLEGASMREIIGRVDSRVSIDVLDATWRHWILKENGEIAAASLASQSTRD